jgi:hypothetical protein
MQPEPGRNEWAVGIGPTVSYAEAGRPLVVRTLFTGGRPPLADLRPTWITLKGNQRFARGSQVRWAGVARPCARAL